MPNTNLEELKKALSEKNYEKVRTVLSAGDNAFATDYVNYCLISAVRKGRLEEAKGLINSFGLSYFQEWSEGYDLLVDAVKNKHAAIAKLLLTRGSRVNNKNEIPYSTPLHFAVINGDIEIVEMIIKKGAEINAKNEYGLTPLHNAIDHKMVEVTELLLKHRADVNARYNDGKSLLHAAAGIGCLQIVEHLLKYGADVNCVCTSAWKKGYTPLHFAVEKGSQKVITLLLSRGANVEVKGEYGITPLHIAAQKGYIGIAKDLLNHGACTNSFTLEKGYTPLHFASELGNEEAMKLFLNKGADINASTKDNSMPLHIAIRRGCGKAVKLLLQHGAKVDNQDKDGKTTLHLAVEKGYLTIVEDVLKYCPDINDQSNRSSLKIAVHANGENYKNIVEALLKYGFIVKAEDANNSDLLHAAAEKGHLKIVEDLLNYGADVNMLDNSAYKHFTPLHTAAKNKQEEIAKLLISYEADINAEDNIGRTPIFYAIENADLKITKLLLTNRADIDCPYLLNTAVKKGSIEIIEALLQHGADINASDELGITALHVTTFSECFGFSTYKDCDIKVEMAKLLLSKGADVDAQTNYGLTTLCFASHKGYAKFVEALLKYNANVNCRTKCHLSLFNRLLDNFSQCGRDAMRMYFLDEEANVLAEQNDGITALHIATEKNHKDVVKVLLEGGANVNSKIKSDITSLHLSARGGNEEISRILLNKGANVNAKRKDGITALHIASEKGHKEVVKVLLECGANVDSKTESGITPLHLAANNDYQEIVETLLKFGANIDSRDENGRTALHSASLEGHEEIVNTLLKYGPDINNRSIYNRTPLNDAIIGCKSNYCQLESYRSHNDSYYLPNPSFCSCELIADAIKRHIVKMKVANLYVSGRNLLSISSSEFLDQCEEEIASMKSEVINMSISFYDILAKHTNFLARYMRNENIVQVLKSDDYKIKFPIYASMIENNFRKGMKRKELLEQGNTIFYFLFNNFPELPYDSREKICNYLSDQDLRNLIDACEPHSIDNPDNNTNIDDVDFTSSISQIHYS